MRGEVTYYDRRLRMPGEPYTIEGRETTDWLSITLVRNDTETAVHLTPVKRQDMGGGAVAYRTAIDHGNPAGIGFKVVLRRDGGYDRAVVDRARGCLDTYGEPFAGMFRDGRFAEISRIIREACADPKV